MEELIHDIKEIKLRYLRVDFIIVLGFDHQLGVHTLILTTEQTGDPLAEFCTQSDMLLLLRRLNNQGIIQEIKGQYLSLVEATQSYTQVQVSLPELN